MIMEHWSNGSDKKQNEISYKTKRCLIVTSSNINSIDNMGHNVARRSEKSDSNCLGHGKELWVNTAYSLKRVQILGPTVGLHVSARMEESVSLLFNP